MQPIPSGKAGPINPTLVAAPITRRGLLRGGLGLAAGLLTVGAVASLAGCDSLLPSPSDPAKHPLTGFLAETATLAERYDTALAAAPALAGTLTQIRDSHRAHAKALAAAMGVEVPKSTTASASPTGDRASLVATLSAAEKLARDAAVSACLADALGAAPLLGSIAAARATHLELLK